MILRSGLWCLLLLCAGCTIRAKPPRGAARETVRDGIWSLVPRDTDWMVLAMPGGLPPEILGRLPQLTRTGPCRTAPPHTVLFLHGVLGDSEAFLATVRLFSGAQEGCRPGGVKMHRTHPVISEAAGMWELWSTRALVQARPDRAQYLVDRAENSAGDDAIEPAGLKQAVARFSPQGESPPVVALWFVRSGRIDRFLRPLFPEPPLRGGLLFFFSGGWVRMRIHLEFADTSTAERAVNELRDGLISAMESKNYPDLDWKTALAPLVVHPEGSLLWVQWSMPVPRALPLFFAVAGKVDRP